MAGRFGNAIQLSSSSSQYVSMGDIYNFTGTPGENFSITAWVKTTATTAEIVAGRHDSGSFNGYFLAINSGSGYGAANTAYFYPSGPPGETPVSGATINDGQWHLLAGRMLGGNAAIFVDDGGATQINGVNAPNSRPRPS